jgi:hypothetical protein
MLNLIRYSVNISNLVFPELGCLKFNEYKVFQGRLQESYIWEKRGTVK